MSKNIKETEPNILPINYDAVNYLSWFITDAVNVQTLAGTIFRGNININEQAFIDLLAAANKSIKEIENDIAKIKECLVKIVPVKSN
jgi:hypothetical protein